jgi:hypothetical protein
MGPLLASVQIYHSWKKLPPNFGPTRNSQQGALEKSDFSDAADRLDRWPIYRFAAKQGKSARSKRVGV